MQFSNEKFPQTFLWGSATSSHQIEGDNKLNDWWEWEQKGLTNDPSLGACDSYHRYEEDFEIAQKMNHNAHRFSIEWSRIQPTITEWNQDELRHYLSVVKALRKRGLEPVVTLHHFTNPQWFAEKGGWENPLAPDWFNAYVQKVVNALGHEVTYWITFNEQNVLCYKGLVEGEWPPGKKSVSSAKKAALLMAKAHIKSYHSIKKIYKDHAWKNPMVGIAHHCLYAQPSNPKSFRDRFAVWFRTYTNNFTFIELIQHEKNNWMAALAGFGGEIKTLDFIGLNYYFREIIKGFSKEKFPICLAGDTDRNHPEYIASEKNDLGWCIYPEGIQKNLLQLKERYNLPIMITENGICTRDENQRKRFLLAHLRQIKIALDKGANVIGYMHWSLLDNFEWSIGYSPKFGLVAVDAKTYERTLKSSAEFYGEICKANALPESDAI